MKTEIWQNENGENLGTEELKVVSSKWTLEEWEHYQANGLDKISLSPDFLEDGNDIETVFSDEVNLWDLIASGIPSNLQPVLPSLKNSLDSLKGKEYRVIKFYYLDGFTDKQISKLLNEKIDTVRQRRLRATRKLKNALAIDKEASDSLLHVTI